MIIDEEKMLQMLEGAKNVLLIEPEYPSKYPPLGLAKVKSFLDYHNIKTTFSRKMRYENYDLICITTLFTYYSKYVKDVIRNRGLLHHDTPILVGGVFASMMPEQFEKVHNAHVFRGYSKVLDGYKPDYKILYRGGTQADDFSYVFTSRGCVNKCAYCVVWRIEKGMWINDKWQDTIDMSRPNIRIMDNNLSAAASNLTHLKSVIDFTVENNKGVSFESGFDCKYITKEMANELSRIKYVNNGMRLAFDRLEEDRIFQNAVNMLKDSGISASGAMMAYVLFNFTDSPKEADYRARQCANLTVRPYVQMYRPLNSLNKEDQYIGKYWTRRLARAFRNFWLDFFLYKNTTFNEYIHTTECLEKFKLTNRDVKMWETNGGKDGVKVKVKIKSKAKLGK